MVHPLAVAIATCREWWVNVYPNQRGEPLCDGIWHATAQSAEQGRSYRARFGEPPALYVVRVRLRRSW